MFFVQALSLSLLFVWLGQLPVDSSRPPKPKPKPDFYTQKLKSYFAHMNANGDDVLSRTDYDIMAHRLIYTVHLTRYDAKILLKKKVPRIWDAFHYDKAGKGKAAKLDEMIDSIKERRSDCTPAFNTSIYDVTSRVFNVIDVDGNGKLSLWEYTTFFTIRGLSAKDAPKSYAAVDINQDGVITHNEFSASATSFFNTNDENCPSKLFYGPIA